MSSISPRLQVQEMLREHEYGEAHGEEPVGKRAKTDKAESTGGGESQSKGSDAGSSVPVVQNPTAPAAADPPAVPVVTPSPISVQRRRAETIGSGTRNRERAYGCPCCQRTFKSTNL
eukprot:6132660-Amphidinium_carterae.1